MLTKLYNKYHIWKYSIPSTQMISKIIFDESVNLTDTKKSVSIFYISGFTIENIAKRHKVTRERIRQILLKISRDYNK
jgi:DNA-directed RNA polymerase sigma subunit (sigma70/sigma32)